MVCYTVLFVPSQTYVINILNHTSVYLSLRHQPFDIVKFSSVSPIWDQKNNDIALNKMNEYSEWDVLLYILDRNRSKRHFMIRFSELEAAWHLSNTKLSGCKYVWFPDCKCVNDITPQMVHERRGSWELRGLSKFWSSGCHNSQRKEQPLRNRPSIYFPT